MLPIPVLPTVREPLRDALQSRCERREEWLNIKNGIGGRRVPYEVLEGVIGRDGDLSVRAELSGRSPPLLVWTCLQLNPNSLSAERMFSQR